MAEIKVGQKWKLVSEGAYQGHEAEITSVTEDYVYYRPGLFFPDGDWRAGKFLRDWELVEEPKPEIKVGQKWKWHEGDDTEFVVLAVGEEEATIEYLGDGGFVVDRPLFYWDAESVLVEDVEEIEPLKIEHLKVGQLVIRKSDGWKRFITAVEGDLVTHKYGRKKMGVEDTLRASDFLEGFRLPDISEVAQFKKDNPEDFAKYTMGKDQEDNQLSPNEDKVNHPSHYGGDTTYEVIKVAEAWGFDNDAYLFNVLKYIARAEHKGSERQDLEKAMVYLDRKIKRLES